MDLSETQFSNASLSISITDSGSFTDSSNSQSEKNPYGIVVTDEKCSNSSKETICFSFSKRPLTSVTKAASS